MPLAPSLPSPPQPSLGAAESNLLTSVIKTMGDVLTKMAYLIKDTYELTKETNKLVKDLISTNDAMLKNMQLLMNETTKEMIKSMKTMNSMISTMIFYQEVTLALMVLMVLLLAFVVWRLVVG